MKEMMLVVDVETLGSVDEPLVYDLGLAVVVRATGEVVESHSLLMYETFCGMPEAMASAYYAEKVPAYRRGIRAGKHRIVKFWTARRMVRDLIAKYSIRRVYAYNMAFDRNALNRTTRELSNGSIRWFFPFGVEYCCIWHMACRSILRSRNYHNFCKKHGYVSKFGNYSTTAETAYAYLSGVPHFEESHTGLEDVEIETAIFSAILKRKKRLYEKVWRGCWRAAQPPKVRKVA